jgi:cytidylate kinase
LGEEGEAMYFITISEMIGTKGVEIATELSKQLNYSFFGEGELLKVAEKMGYFLDVKRLDEKGPGFYDRFFSEKPIIYFDRLQSVMYEVAREGNALFFGKGSQLLLHDFDCALHVLVTGSREKRIARIAEEHKVGRDVAEEMVDRSDHDKRSFLRFAFDEDWLNPKLYDVILNTDKLSVDSAVKMILNAANSQEIKACGIDSVKKLGRLSLNRQIESALLEQGLAKAHIFFDVENEDSVRIYGIALSQEEKDRTEEVLKGLKGVKTITNDVGVYTGVMGT